MTENFFQLLQQLKILFQNKLKVELLIWDHQLFFRRYGKSLQIYFLLHEGLLYKSHCKVFIKFTRVAVGTKSSLPLKTKAEWTGFNLSDVVDFDILVNEL